MWEVVLVWADRRAAFPRADTLLECRVLEFPAHLERCRQPVALLAVGVQSELESLSCHLATAIRSFALCDCQVRLDTVDTACVRCMVFSTEYRYRVLDGDAVNWLRAIFDKVCTDFAAQLIEMDGEDNHVRLLVNYPPKHSISTLVNSLEGVSSRLVRWEGPDLVRRYWKGVLWSPSYIAASCGGAPIGVLKAYIEQQTTPL